MSADLVLTGGNVVTMAPQGGHPARALAVERGRIVAIGSEDEILSLVDDHTRVVELGGRTVLPGFVDTHVHLVQTGLGLAGPDLAGCRSVEQVLEHVRAGLDGHPAGRPAFYHRCVLASLDRPLTRRDLDRLAPSTPLGVGDIELNRCVVNSAALDVLEIAPETRGLDRSGSGGEPTGLVAEEAHVQARAFFYDALDDAARLDCARRACELALRAGVTTVHAIEGREAFGCRDLPVLAESRQALPLRLVLYSQSADLSRAAIPGVKGIGDLWADGAYVDRSAALVEPYADDPATCGHLNYRAQDLERLVFRANALGLQVSFHAIGDAAIEQVLDAYERVQQGSPDLSARCPRIEHFSLASEAQIERAVRLGVGVAMQPAMSAGPQETVARRLGPERARRRHAYRTIVDAGLLVAGGSDSDVTPICPLAGIHAVVNQSEESRRLSLPEALALFTVNGARLASEEAVKGTLEPGKLADMVVLERDPFSVPLDEIGAIPVAMTLVGGQVRWARPGFGAGTAQESGGTYAH